MTLTKRPVRWSRLLAGCGPGNEFGPVATIMTLRASTVSALPEQLVP